MAITYDGANGLFTRLGKLVGMMDAVRTHQNNLKTELADVQSVYSSADSYMIEQLVGNLEARIAQTGGILNDIRMSAEKTLIEMCYADAKTSTRNAMENRTVRDALVWLIREMSADAESVDETTNSKGVISYGASNNGNGVLATFSECPNILLSNTSVWPNCRTELIDVRCIQDAQDGSIASGSEAFEIRGQPAFDELDYRFPAGSGKRVRMTCVSGHVDAGPRGQNILSNSDFEDQTSNVPLLFTVTSGTAGTDFLTETGTYWRGAKSVKAAATSTTWEIRQQLGTSSGTVGKLVPDRPYMISVALKKDVGATHRADDGLPLGGMHGRDRDRGDVHRRGDGRRDDAARKRRPLLRYRRRLERLGRRRQRARELDEQRRRRVQHVLRPSLPDERTGPCASEPVGRHRDDRRRAHFVSSPSTVCRACETRSRSSSSSARSTAIV